MKRVLLIPGDGIGCEVMLAAKKLISAICDKFKLELNLEEVDWGAERFLREGVGIPNGEIEKIPNKYDAILFGALGDPRIPDMAHGKEILLKLRFGLDLYINMRPIKLLHKKLSPLKDERQNDIDIVIFRENTEDIYVGAGGSLKEGSSQECSVDESIHTYFGVKRIIKAAFSYARKNKKQKVTLIDKSNAIKFGGKLWQRVFQEVSRNYPDIYSDHLFVDVAAMKMISEPRDFEVIVTSNLFGDIISDLGAGLVGGLGLCSSANINPKTIPLFEPVHGSAPDIANKNIANPYAMFLCVALMFEQFEMPFVAEAIEKIIKDCIAKNLVTSDIGGSLNTEQATKSIISHLENPYA